VGRESLERALLEKNIRLPKEEVTKALEKLVAEYKLASVDDLFSEIGFGSLRVSKILAKAFPEPAAAPAKEPPSAAPTPAGANEVIIEGCKDLDVRRAQCCNPLPGDEIVGFITRGRGLSVHRIECPNIRNLLKKGGSDAHRLLPARWSNDDPENYRLVDVNVYANDTTGLLNALSGLITAQGLFITRCSSRSNMKKQTAALTFRVRVRHEMRLITAVEHLLASPSVLEVDTEEVPRRPRTPKKKPAKTPPESKTA